MAMRWSICSSPALAALLGITAGTLYQKRFCPRFDLRTGSVMQFLPSLVVTLLVASQTETMEIEWTGDFVFALGWLVLVLSIGAISLLNLLIRSGSAVNVASLFYLTPPTTALIAWAMFDETLSALAIAGMAIAVAGVLAGAQGLESGLFPTPQEHAMLMTTTQSLDGQPIRQYLGVVNGEAIIGANLFKDMFASIRNVVGGRAGSYERTLADARRIAMEEMEEAAQKLGANAVIGIDVDYEVLGADNGMLMVCVSGTAVKI